MARVQTLLRQLHYGAHLGCHVPPHITSKPSAAPKASASGAPTTNPPNSAAATKPQGNQTASDLMKTFQDKLKALAMKSTEPADEVPDSQELV